MKNIGWINREIHTGCAGPDQLGTLVAAQDANFATTNWRASDAQTFFFDAVVTGGSETQQLLFANMNRTLGTDFVPTEPNPSGRTAKRRKKTSEAGTANDPDTNETGRSEDA